MKYIGAHVSTQTGVAEAPLRAHEIGARSFALFTKNPSRWKSPAISPKQAALFTERCEEYGYRPSMILPHDSFLINLGSPEPEKLEKSREAFLDELRRCEMLGLTMLNFHPGSHLKLIDTERCLELIAESINISLEQTKGVKAVLENTAGQGSNLGHSFEQLAYIIDRIDDKERVGVCIDTCHTYAAGYDIATKEGYENFWNEFDRKIGLKYLSGMHLNDSKKGLASHVDRHEKIGEGTLGIEFFRMLMQDPRVDNIPLILETPDESIWQQEIATLISLAEN